MEDRERYMQQEDPFLDWLEKYRAEMSEIIKDMTPEEICEFYDKRTEDSLKKSGIKVLTVEEMQERRRLRDEARAAKAEAKAV